MMKNRSVLTGLLCGMTALGVQGAFLIDSGETLNLALNTNWGTNALWMGVNTSGNGLLATNGISVAAGDAHFGHSATSTGNFVKLGNYSLLSLSGTLFLGDQSAGNSLEVRNGAVAYSALDGVIGNAATADGNTVLVSGSNSYWQTDGNLFVGYGGSSNRMDLVDGAEAFVGGSLWVGVEAGSSHNQVALSDSSMVLGGAMVVGYDGSDNRVQVLDGAQVWSVEGYVGNDNNADNNQILVSGTNSIWTVVSGLYIGNQTNSGNRVTVTNQGALVIHQVLAIEGSNELNLDKDGLLMVLSDMDASMSGFHYNDGSTLYVAGTLSGMTPALEGGRTLGLFSEEGAWNLNGSNLAVGAASSGNTLYVENGAVVAAGDVAVASADSATGNKVSVLGDGALLDIAGQLSIGTASNSGNVVEVSSGGTIVLGSLAMGGASNLFTLGDGGWLAVSNDFDASAPGFDFLAGGTLEVRGVLDGMNASIEDGRALLLTGSNAVWNPGTNLLYVGGVSSSNALTLSAGAVLSGSGARIGSLNTTANRVTVDGDSSGWLNTGNLLVDGFDNALRIQNGGHVAIGQQLAVKNQGMIAFVSNGYASASSYFQDATAVFAFESATNAGTGPFMLTVSDTAELEGGATLAYTGSISGLDRGVILTNRLISADTLIVNGITNASGADLEALKVTGLGSLLDIQLVSENDDLYALILRMSLAESAGFADGTDMAAVCDEIDLMADNGNALADNMLNILSALDSTRQNAQVSQLYDRHAPTYAHAKGMLEGFKQARSRGVVPDLMLPRGVYGPHFYGTQAQGWIKGYGSWGQRDGSEDYSGYDQTTHGFLLGFDKTYGDLMTGIAGGTTTSEISQDDGDESSADTLYGLFYVSAGTLSWFGDLNVGYGRSDIEDRSGTLFNPSANYNANQLAFYLGGGKESIFLDDRFFLTPSAAMSGSYYLQESYTESSSTSVPRNVEEFDYFSLQSEIGIKACYIHQLRMSYLEPELHASWQHEFNADPDRIGYSLVGGTGDYSFGMQAPVEDLCELGIGLAWWMRGRTGAVYEWSAGLDGRMGDGYTEVVGSLRLLGQF